MTSYWVRRRVPRRDCFALRRTRRLSPLPNLSLPAFTRSRKVGASTEAVKGLRPSLKVHLASPSRLRGGQPDFTFIFEKRFVCRDGDHAGGFLSTHGHYRIGIHLNGKPTCQALSYRLRNALDAAANVAVDDKVCCDCCLVCREM